MIVQEINEAVLESALCYPLLAYISLLPLPIQIVYPLIAYNAKFQLYNLQITHTAHQALAFVLIHRSLWLEVVFALTWKDIDFDNKRILVNKSLVKTEEGLFKAATKTKSSNRNISISSFVVTELQAYYFYKKKAFFRWGISLNEEAYIFAGNTIHSPLHIDAPHRFLKDHYKKAGVPRIRIHDLRHTHATLMLQAGEHPKIVQDRLGHSSIQMTLEKYSHITQNMQQQAAENFENVIKPYENIK